MRSLIAQIGNEAGLAAEYWRDGFYFYDDEAGGKALMEQRWTEKWAGEIHVQTQGKQAQLLLERVVALLDERHTLFGASPVCENEVPRAPRETAPPLDLKPAHEPTDQPEYYVSYAWGDKTPEGRERDLFVDRLCNKAAAKGFTIIRDKTELNYGDRISKFMERIGRAGCNGRIFIVLGDKYLKSPFCMFELFDVWRNCREDPDEFISRTRVFVLPCARISTAFDRANYSRYWRTRSEELHAFVKEHGSLDLSDKDLADYRRITRFANDTANILHLVQDVLQPRDFDEFVAYGFKAPPNATH